MTSGCKFIAGRTRHANADPQRAERWETRRFSHATSFSHALLLSCVAMLSRAVHLPMPRTPCNALPANAAQTALAAPSHPSQGKKVANGTNRSLCESLFPRILQDKASKMPVQAFLKHPFAPSKQSQDCTDVTIRALFALKAHRRLRKDKDVPTTRGRKRTRVAGLSSRTKQCGLCAIRASNDMDFARYGPRTLRPLP